MIIRYSKNANGFVEFYHELVEIKLYFLVKFIVSCFHP